MGKLPAFQFYPGDWVQDTRPLSLAAKGAWIDLLCAMWRSQTRGTLSLPWQGYARLIGATVDQTKAVVVELIDMQICNVEINGKSVICNDDVTECNTNVTLINRRMLREEKERNQTRIRVERFRNDGVKRSCNANVTPPSSSSSSFSKKEKKESTKEKKADAPAALHSRASPDEVKKPYGNLMLTDVECEKLKEKFNSHFQDILDYMNLKIESKGEKEWRKAYKSDYATILVWNKRGWLPDNAKKEVSIFDY